MSNIFSNRFFQGGIAITAIGIAFFAYQSFAGENIDSDIGVITTAETSLENSTIEAENAVNKTENLDTINTAAEETTNK